MPAPLVLETEPHAGGVTFRVVGTATAAVAANFTLEVLAGNNRSTHRGTARLQPGERVVLSTIAVSTGGVAPWAATLHVACADGRTYEQAEQSA